MLFNQINNSSLIYKILIVCSTIIIMTGCTKLFPNANDNSGDNSILDGEITIYSSFQDQYFYIFYGNYLVQNYPNLRFNLIQAKSRDSEEMLKEIEKHQPDLIITWENVFQALQNKNMLTDLNMLNKSNDINFEDYYPQMISTLQNEAGNLNGMSPNVHASAIFYNKSIFDSYGIDYPTNQMSWEEILLLSQKFIGTEKAGFSGLSLVSIFNHMATANRWEIVDYESDELFFNTEAWTSSFQTILDSSKENNTVNDMGELFLQGNAAIHYGSLDTIDKLEETNLFDWNIVTAPVNPINRDKSYDIYFYDIFCIPETASQKEMAWKVLQNLLSEDAVDYIQRNSIPGSVSTLSKYMNTQYSHVDLTAIWQQSIDNNPYLSYQLSQNFIEQFDEIVDSVLTKAINNNMSAEQSFSEIEETARLLYEEEQRVEGE